MSKNSSSNDEPEMLEDDHPEDAAPIEDAPDEQLAAEPVPHKEVTVVGRKNPDVPTENLTVPPVK